jgi:hypothetical protein
VSRYQRLSVLDRTFLDFESDAYPQHVGATLIFEVGPLRNEADGVDADRVRQLVASRLHRIPRYRQKLAWIPVENHPVRVDETTASTSTTTCATRACRGRAASARRPDRQLSRHRQPRSSRRRHR